MYSSVIVCGCTKNSAGYIYKHLENLYSIAPLFKTFKVLVYENNSTDNTVEILKQFKQTHLYFDYISEKLSIHHRTDVLAHGRNTLVSHTNGFEYMIMSDLDDVMQTFNPEQIHYLFETTEWDGLLANCVGKYYDIWALRIERDKWTPDCPFQIIDFDCWEQPNGREIVSKYQKKIPVSDKLIPVTSAFGGFGIYKVNKLIGKYNGFEGKRCEHVEFNKGLNLFICPKFLVNEHPFHIVDKS